MHKELFFEFIVSLLASFGLTVLLSYYIIPILKGHKVGQSIRAEGPSWHSSKAGTPTMGGICFIMAILFVSAGFTLYYALREEQSRLIPLALTLGLAVFNGLIGFIDDYKKLIKKENEGLTESQKLLLQIVVSTAYLCMMGMTGNLLTSLDIPFTSIRLELGWFAYPLYLLVLVGFANSTNITDGLDGLASSVGVASSLGIIAMSLILGSRYTAVSSAMRLGALLGFLVFNRYPAKVFMGDTGSLFIGGIIMGCAVGEGRLIAVIIMSMVFILDMLSSLWQRLYFKMTHGKRFFKRAPVHHHFQKLDWSEVKIVWMFFAVAILFAVIGVLGVAIK